MKKFIVISTLIILSLANLYGQTISTETSGITAKEFNEETYGFQATVKKKNGSTVSLHNTLRMEKGDKLNIQVNREVNGQLMSNSGKKWFLAVILFHPNRSIEPKNVLFRDLRQFNNNYTFNAYSRVIPIIFLMTREGDGKELADVVGNKEGKEAVKELSSGLNKYSNVLNKIQEYSALTKKLLEEPPADYKTQSAFDLRLKQISNIFNVEMPPSCNDEMKKQLSANYTLRDWRLKTAECIALNVDASKIKINWLATSQVVVSELKNTNPAIFKYSSEIGLAVELVGKFIVWYKNRKPRMLFAPAIFKKGGDNEYRIFTQESVVVRNFDYAIIVMPKPVGNLSVENPSSKMTAAFLGETCFCAGINVFNLSDNNLIANNSVNFFLEIGDKRFPLKRGDSNSFVLDLNQEDIPTVPADGKLKAKVVGEYDFDQKIISNEMELNTSTEPDTCTS